MHHLLDRWKGGEGGAPAALGFCFSRAASPPVEFCTSIFMMTSCSDHGLDRSCRLSSTSTTKCAVCIAQCFIVKVTILHARARPRTVGHERFDLELLPSPQRVTHSQNELAGPMFTFCFGESVCECLLGRDFVLFKRKRVSW